ncbi:class I SAM-dependent methyltransferase [Halorhodospira halophila]|uniref:SAM-dependent methyltransferase n=1 Tax=Halorhodospira halophila (strain DSM 244 / SL1) TaxID=349124 RepID=A1WWR1_HALHL|nr:class I SAM-dependent methyltransferase [Halorhodospira halophila]ABM62123.1 conserved hypothetical protein [Halorhodospira halophila SL1]MBK1729451.1 hypothetical protein [Halorhodospira halophila]
MFLEALIFVVTLGGMLLIVGYTMVTGISPLPSSRLGHELVRAALPAELEGTVVEAGSGWGGLARSVGRRCPRARVIGYELSPLPWLFACVLQWLWPVPNVEFRRRDLRRVSCSDAAAVVCYLHLEAIRELEPRWRAELPPGALVVSNTFRIPGWRPSAIYQPPVRLDAPVYVYRIPQAYCGRVEARS